MFLMLSSLALATQLDIQIEPCPTGKGTARVYTKVSANTHGGWDSDLVSYSTEGQYRAYAIATCTQDLFTVYGRDMAKLSPTDAQLSQIGAKLDEIQKAAGNPNALEVWDRYLIAGEMYKILEADHRRLYQLYLEASWTARDEAVGVYIGLEGPVQARDLLGQGAVELKRTDLSARQRKVLLHNLARVAHRGGFVPERDAYLQAFEQVGTLDKDEAEALKRFRWIVTEVEPKLQRLAMAELQAYMATEPGDPIELIRATYLLADLYRRNGEFEIAVQGYALVAVHPDSPAQLKDLSAWFGAQL
ncbi:MAG: hypothetical protein ACI9VR_000674 [Cognaticolwellia sp.]|jgi:hypothetical protein